MTTTASAAKEALAEMEATIESRKLNSFVEVDMRDLLNWQAAFSQHFATATTGEGSEELPANCEGEDCRKCSGEYCERHPHGGCDCDVLDRHGFDEDLDGMESVRLKPSPPTERGRV